MPEQAIIDASVQAYVDRLHEFQVFLSTVRVFLEAHPELIQPPLPVLHSVKLRLKEAEHLRGKLGRKWDSKDPITADNIFERITDLAGVRLLHLHTAQIPIIHRVIMQRVNNGDWVLNEQPVAYSWDPETIVFFSDLGIRPEIKASYYTSVHYTIRPRAGSPVCCEVQVRTLFEEVWGEIDHRINYPQATSSLACREQLKVLAKLVSTGTRLADSIFRTHEEEPQG